MKRVGTCSAIVQLLNMLYASINPGHKGMLRESCMPHMVNRICNGTKDVLGYAYNKHCRFDIVSECFFNYPINYVIIVRDYNKRIVSYTGRLITGSYNHISWMACDNGYALHLMINFEWYEKLVPNETIPLGFKYESQWKLVEGFDILTCGKCEERRVVRALYAKVRDYSWRGNKYHKSGNIHRMRIYENNGEYFLRLVVNPFGRGIKVSFRELLFIVNNKETNRYIKGTLRIDDELSIMDTTNYMYIFPKLSKKTMEIIKDQAAIELISQKVR